MANVTVKSPTTASEASTTYTGALAIVTSLFFMWGFVTVLNDILVPHLKAIFDLSYTKVMLIQFAFFSAYFIFSIPSAKLIDWVGYKRTMVIGLMTMGVGALLFLPAATAASYVLFLCALMVLAAGITALQVAANPYVAVLGPEKTASSRLNLTQAFNSLGTTIGAKDQPLEIPASRAWHSGDLRLRGRGSFHRKLSDQLFHAEEHREYHGSGGGGVRGVLLGRRDGGQVYRISDPAEGKDRSRAGRGRY